MIILCRLEMSFKDSSFALSKGTVRILRLSILILPLVASVSLALDVTLPGCLSTWSAPDLAQDLLYCWLPVDEMILYKYQVITVLVLWICALNIVFAVLFTVKLLSLIQQMARTLTTKTDAELLKLKGLILRNDVLTIIGCVSTLLGTITLSVSMYFDSSFVVSGYTAYIPTTNLLFLYIDGLINCLVIGAMFQHNAKYFNFLCGSLTDICIEHWTKRTRHHQALLLVESVSQSSYEAIDRATTAMNEFSMYRAPGTQRVTNLNLLNNLAQRPTLIVTEDEVDDEESITKRVADSSMMSTVQMKSTSTLLNDFVIEESANDHSASSINFDFGVYLEYWRSDRKNYVLPKYGNLKEELTKNRHSPITEQQFNELRQKCERYLSFDFKAKDVGMGNEICQIAAGSLITIAHLMAMKVYTDFDETQREFKRHCRRQYEGESVESVMERNCEIAIWCRLMRECVMFWGKRMNRKEVFYCGLTARLVLNSTEHRFECPLSTTRNRDVAERFTDEYQGVILKIKRANAHTRYFNTVPISCHSHEEERVFIGSTMKIIGILAYNENSKEWNKWESLKPKYLVSALAMFEQIYNGHFIDGKAETRILLMELIHLTIGDTEAKRMSF